MQKNFNIRQCLDQLYSYSSPKLLDTSCYYCYEQYTVEHNNIIYLENLNAFGATYRPHQDLYTNIYSIKTFVEREHKKHKNNSKIVLIKNSKASFYRFRNCLVTANKESDNRNNCMLGVDRI